MNGWEHAWAALTGTAAIPAAFAGVAWGMLGGALPGISPSIAMALLLPFTYGMDPITAVVLLGATYVGAEYGGSIPAILIRTPGTNSAAATVLDGYAMHRQGRGGEALGLSLMSGVIGGLAGLLLLIVLTGPLARVALLFTPAAYFALGILGISVIASLSSGSVVKGLMAGVAGLMIATVGTDPLSGVNRFTFGRPELLGGIEFILVMVGVFAMTELFTQAGLPEWEKTRARDTHIKLPNWAMLKRIKVALGIGVGIGTFEGVMPGAGGTIASFMSYNEARRWSKHPEEFGKGSPEGIAAPEAANNVVAGTALVPTLAFGIPGSNSTAILLGALMIHGMEPGPLLLAKSPDVVYGLFGGLLVANVAQLLIGILIMTPAIWLVNRPKPYLLAAIYALVFSGIYTIDHSLFDLGVVLAAGVLGYLMRWFGFPFLPLVLGLVLGYMIEANYRRALVIVNGDHWVFLRDPVSALLLGLALVFIVGSALRGWRSARRARAAEASQA
ncbi:tripartite tricarboxylate transporter permease [Faunimonas sp. B44]|uniref:tripartite tricarboxylate transporter permease n=1 Tax=Faunimonas sp. B44 TaxID=3461493 RepID=UPI004044D10D